MIWSVEYVPARGEQELVLDLTPTEGRTFELHVDIAVQPSQAKKRIAIQEPKLEIGINGPAQVVFGETGVWNLEFKNPGTGPANDVVVDIFSGRRKLVSESVGTIPAGETRSALLELTATDVGRHQIRAVAQGKLELRANTNCEFLCQRGDLSLDLLGSKVEYAGSSSEYELILTNSGDASVKRVLLICNCRVACSTSKDLIHRMSRRAA